MTAQLRPGDRVRIQTNDGSELLGTVLRVFRRLPESHPLSMEMVHVKPDWEHDAFIEDGVSAMELLETDHDCHACGGHGFAVVGDGDVSHVRRNGSAVMTNPLQTQSKCRGFVSSTWEMS